MKAVIAVSGLAGFLLFGVPFLHSHNSDPSRMVRLHTERVRAEAVHRVVVSNAQDRCRYEAQRDLVLPVGSDGEIALEVGSGSLEVVGVPGLAEIRATGRACASSEDLLEELRLTGDERGSTVLLKAHYPGMSGWSWGGERYARLDLRVEVPEGLAGEIRDGSGEITVSGLGALRIEDGSGGISVRDIRGDLDIDDGSGEVVVEGVRGSVRIDDGSGEVRVLDVTGDVEVDDSSGDVEVQGVTGSVLLSDSSGEIDVREVGATVRVIEDSSGSIEVDGVGGDFIVERDGSGSIRHRNVQGTVDIPRKSR